MPLLLLRGFSDVTDPRLSPLTPVLSLLLLTGALLLPHAPRTGRALVSAVILVTGLLIAPRWGRLPLGALSLAITMLSLLAWIWGWTLPPRRPFDDRPELVTLGATLAAALISLLALFADLGQLPVYAAVVTAPLLVILSIQRSSTSPRTRLVVGMVAAALLLTALLLRHLPTLMTLLGLTSTLGCATFAARCSRQERLAEPARWSDFLHANPARSLVLTFLAVIAVGTVLLALPAAGGRGPVEVIDAFFTSTSATCVTGLTVLDTPRDFSTLGQVVILGLIQVGGLGIMIFSVAGMALTGRRLSLRQEAAALEIVGAPDRSHITQATRVVLLVTLLSEAIGAVILTGCFALAGDPAGRALWHGCFTAVSAFCNAGFALRSDNLIAYQESLGVLLTVAALIVLGGLGPAVVQVLPRMIRRRTVPLQVRLVIWTTLGLLSSGTIFILAVEWRHALRRLGLTARLGNALFHAVSPRTAGFNSLEISALRPATLWITMGLMFVGGSPASTAGGIKTTTAALLLLMIHAALTGRTHVRALGFRVAQPSIYRAAAIATLTLLTVVVVVTVLQLTQEMPASMAAFESVSALGTVGLSTGGTLHLDAVGKLLIAVTMFAGRVGPLTLFMFLSARRPQDRDGLPEEEVTVG